MAGQGQINLEMLIRVVADQARRELGATATEARGLTVAAKELGQSSAGTGAHLGGLAKGAATAAAPVNVLAQATAGSAAEFTAYVASLGRASTAVAGTRSAITGLTTNVAAQTAEIAAARAEAEAWQAALDDTRARFNPLFAASRQYEVELRAIAEAEEMGAISAREAAAARDRAAQSMTPMTEGLRQHTISIGQASAANANLIAQGNDIMMMTMAGQAPLMLALQQGTQISQQLSMVAGQGGSVVRALGASVMGLISPLNLATIAIVGLGAAGIQWLMSMQKPAKTLDDRLQELEETLDRVKERLDVLGDVRLDERFGSMSGVVRDLAANLLELDRAAELKQLQETLAALSAQTLDPSLWQRLNAGNEAWTPGATFGDDGGAAVGAMEDRLRGENYAKLGVANSYADFQRRQEEIMAAARAGDGEAVTQGLGDLAAAMRGDKAVTQMSDEALKLLLTIGQIAQKTAEVEAHFNGSAQAARVAREATALTADYRQQAEMSRAMLLYGENSAQVEALRARHAREAVEVRLQEIGVQKGSKEEAEALAAFEAAQNVERARAAAERGAAAGQIVSDLNQQIALSDAILRYGENSAEVEKVREAQAREALKVRLEELGLAPGLIDMAMQLLETEQARARAIKEAEGARQASDLMAGLQNEAAIAQAALTYGQDSVQVKELQIAADRRAFAQQVEALPIAQAMKDALMAQWEATKGLASADPYGAIAGGQQILRGQADRITELRLELSLAGQTEAVRLRMMALYRAEQEIRDKNIAANSDLAEQIRSGAVEEAALEQRLDRITDAWGRVDGAAGSAIDKMIDGLTGGGLDDALRNVAQELLNLWSELALKNPLKNAILGQDLPTMADVGGLGGIFQRLTGGGKGGAMDLSVSAMSAASMAVTTPMVTINAAGIAGLPVGAAGAVPGAAGASMAGLPGSGDVQAQIWSFFQGKGLAPHQIAGIMGNASAESGFNPLAVGDGGNALGLFQWNDRAPAMLNAIGGRGNLGNVQAQLEFAWHELMTSENGAYQRLMASGNVNDATQAFVGFERPSGYSAQNPTGAMHWDKRLGAAEAALTKFGDTTLAAQSQLGQLGTGAAGLGSGLQTFGASLAGTIQGIAGQHGIGGAVAGGFLGWLGKTLEIPGFATGGWTGAGHPSSVAGVVHAEEYVFDAAATRRIGVDNLEALRRGSLKGYRSGGYVTGGTPPMSRAGADETGKAEAMARRVVHEINVSGTGDRQIFEGVHQAISASFDQYSRDFLPGEVRSIVNDKWRS